MNHRIVVVAVSTVWCSVDITTPMAQAIVPSMRVVSAKTMKRERLFDLDGTLGKEELHGDDGEHVQRRIPPEI